MHAAGIVYNAGGKVLLLKRSPSAVHGGTWGLPAGGIEAGETAEQAALREFGEETGSPCGSPLTHVRDFDGFGLYRVDGQHFEPVLNDEHTDAIWCDLSSLPVPMHPGLVNQLRACADQCAMDYAEFVKPSARDIDQNGYIRIEGNPITRAGVFQYSGRNLPGGDPNQIYNVYRPLEELTHPAALESMRGLPLVDDHEMLGDKYARGAEERGIHGWTGDDVAVEGNDIKVSLRIVSRALKRLLESGKKGLSMGYNCDYEKSAGVWNGIAYDYIQRFIRGNHLALVIEGRVGTEVLDNHWACDHFDLALDTQGEDVMADEKIADTTKEEVKEPTVADCMAMLEKLMPLLEVADKLKGGVATEAAAEEIALDEDKEGEEKEMKEEKKEKVAMDAAEISTLKARLAKLEGRDSTAKAELVSKVVPVVGTFDHSAMDAADVAKYSCEKLGLKVDAGSEAAALTGYLAAVKKNSAVAYAMDSKAPKAGGKLASTLKARA